MVCPATAAWVEEDKSIKTVAISQYWANSDSSESSSVRSGMGL